MSWSLSLGEAPPPTVAVEIAASHVAAASVVVRGARPEVTAQAVEALPEGAVVPSLTTENIRDRATVAAAVGRVLEAVGRPKRIALILPDPVAKISLLRFEHVPAKAQDLDQLVRWQMRKVAPFPPEEAQITWVEGVDTPEGKEFVVSLARAEVVREYEAICAGAGAYAGLVDTATFNVINAVLAVPAPSAADWLLVNVVSDYTSVAILRGPHLMFFRSRSADSEGTLSDLVHQTAMYYEDRLSGGGFDHVLLNGATASDGRQADDAEQIRRNLQERLGKPVDTVAARLMVDVQAGAGEAAAAGGLAPLIGVLLRHREVAHA